jgi:hypothetical protein
MAPALEVGEAEVTSDAHLTVRDRHLSRQIVDEGAQLRAQFREGVGRMPPASIARSFSSRAAGACACRKLNPHILVMQSAQDRTAEYATNGLDGARDRRILVQGEVRARLVVALIERCYDAIIAEGLAFHEAQAPLAQPVKGGGKRRGRVPRRTGHNLLLRLATRKQDTLRFLHDPKVPFTNNQAERDGRMMKLRQKISGGFRSVEGAMDFALIRSLFSTAKKQGWNVIDALTCDPANLAKSLRLS